LSSERRGEGATPFRFGPSSLENTLSHPSWSNAALASAALRIQELTIHMRAFPWVSWPKQESV
jgi:hypothetical protein